MQIIDPLKGGQTELLDVIRCGNVLFLLPDQLYVVPPGTPRSPHLVPIDYLGHTVNLETGGLRLCKRLETAVFTALPTFIDNQYRIKIEPFELPTTGLNPPALAADLQHFMNKVAGCIQKQPFLWRDLRRADLLPRLGIPETT
jgi:lauroyl/myristoyl acyltransferase